MQLVLSYCISFFISFLHLSLPYFIFYSSIIFGPLEKHWVCMCERIIYLSDYTLLVDFKIHIWCTIRAWTKCKYFCLLTFGNKFNVQLCPCGKLFLPSLLMTILEYIYPDQEQCTNVPSHFVQSQQGRNIQWFIPAFKKVKWQVATWYWLCLS